MDIEKRIKFLEKYASMRAIGRKILHRIDGKLYECHLSDTGELVKTLAEYHEGDVVLQFNSLDVLISILQASESTVTHELDDSDTMYQ